MKTKNLISLLAAMVLAIPSLQAQVIPGRWEKVESLNPGTEIIVRLNAGDRLEGTFNGIGDDHIKISDTSGKELMLPKLEVRKIETTTKVPDGLKNGTLIGLGIGVAAGLTAVGITGAVDNDPAGGLMVLAGASLGAIAGVVVDASIKGHEVIYKAP